MSGQQRLGKAKDPLPRLQVLDPVVVLLGVKAVQLPLGRWPAGLLEMV
jgi:hypothetical protein